MFVFGLERNQVEKGAGLDETRALELIHSDTRKKKKKSSFIRSSTAIPPLKSPVSV
jgi:hypothetical protein